MHNTCVTIPGYGPRYKYTAKRLDCGNFYYAKQSCKDRNNATSMQSIGVLRKNLFRARVIEP